MIPNPPCSSGCTTSSTPPAPAADSTTPADEACPASADGWTRTAPDRIERAGFRIDKGHVARLLAEPAPIYYCHAPGGVFIGAAPSPDDAKALCESYTQRGNPQ